MSFGIDLEFESLLAKQPPNVVLLSVHIVPQTLARYAIALANTSGGVIVMGASDDGWEDASDIHPLQLTHAIFELTEGKLNCYVHHHTFEEKKLLLAHIPQAPYLLATPEGEVLGWENGSLVPLQGLGRTPQAEPDYTESLFPFSTLSDLDPLEVARMRRNLQGRSSDLANLPDLDFLTSLGLLVSKEDILHPTLAAILTVGTPQALKRYIPQAEICYYHHRTSDIEFQFREDILKPLPAALERLRELIQARNGFAPLQVGLFRIEVWDFDEVVYREAILNALIHRDYQSRDVVHIHHYPDRLEISNPGGLSGGITSENILRHQPKRRNPLLAEAFMKLGYIERAGVGVDKMYQLLLRHGKEPPEYVCYPDSVNLIIRNPEFDVEFVRFVARKQEEMQTFSLDILIVLAQLKRYGEATREDLARALQLPTERILRILSVMEEARLIARIGRGKDSVYLLSESSRLAMGTRPKTTGGHLPALQAALKRPRETTEIQKRRPRRSKAEIETVILNLAGRPQGVRNADVREALNVGLQTASKYLRTLCLQGWLTRLGASRTSYYTLSNLG